MRTALKISHSPCALALLAGAGFLAPMRAADVDFARDVQPILVESCQGCHGANRTSAICGSIRRPRQ